MVSHSSCWQWRVVCLCLCSCNVCVCVCCRPEVLSLSGQNCSGTQRGQNTSTPPRTPDSERRTSRASGTSWWASSRSRQFSMQANQTLSIWICSCLWLTSSLLPCVCLFGMTSEILWTIKSDCIFEKTIYRLCHDTCAKAVFYVTDRSKPSKPLKRKRRWSRNANLTFQAKSGNFPTSRSDFISQKPRASNLTTFYMRDSGLFWSFGD